MAIGYELTELYSGGVLILAPTADDESLADMIAAP